MSICKYDIHIIRLDKTIWAALQNDADGADFQGVEIGVIACVRETVLVSRGVSVKGISQVP